jgi:DNA-binding CsgD family transcriptional regulator
MTAIVRSQRELAECYPILQSDPVISEAAFLADSGFVICVPVIYSGVAVGAVMLLQDRPVQWDPGDWQFLDGVTAALGMWMNNQRDILVDHWRRAAPLPLREVRISERQRQILELIGSDRTNGEIARELGYSIPTIKKDLQQMMRVLGTVNRRSTAGRAREIGLLPERRRGE